MASKQWELKASDRPVERARKLAEIAFADFANTVRTQDMIERAVYRLADALEKYEAADSFPKEPVEGQTNDR